MVGSILKRLTVVAAAGVAAYLGLATLAKPADAQISIQVPFVSLGIGVPAYYPYYAYYPRCHWRHHRCHYY